MVRLLLAAAALLLVAAGAFAAVSELATHAGRQTSNPRFLTRALGAETRAAPLVRMRGSTATARITSDGFAVGGRGAGLALTSEDRGSGPWQPHRNGATRPAPFGRETVLVGPTSAEQLLTVVRHQGTRTWRWRLAAGTLEPRLSPAGVVTFRRGGRSGGFAILPVKILDGRGRDVTPHGLHWSLAHDAAGWRLELRLADAGLPLPYVIDPTAATSVSFAASSLSTQTAGTTTSWNVSFTPTTTGLASGSTITVTFDGGFTVPAAPTVTLGGGFTKCVVNSASGSGGVATITLGNAGAGSSNRCSTSGTLSLTIAGVTNPAAGTYAASTFSIVTSKDTAAANPGSAVVIAGPATQFVLGGTTSPVTAGATSSITVTAQDANGNTAWGYTGTVSLSSATDAQATFGGSHTFSSTDAGAYTFTNGITLKTAGSQTVTASDGTISKTTGTITVTPATASQFSIAAPSPVTAGSSQTITITAKDPYGNAATGYAGTHSLTFAGPSTIGSNVPTIGGATVGSAVSLTFDASAQATAAMVLYKKETATITATASSPSVTTPTGASVQVGDAGLASFSFSGLPASATVGAALGSGSLTAHDAYGNTATSFNASTNNVTLSSGGATISGLSGGNKLNAALDFNGTGVASLSGLVYSGTAGTVAFTASATGGSGTSGNVTMGAGAATRFSITGTSPQTAGSSQSITIKALDAGGNLATSYVGTKSLTFSGASSIGSYNPTVNGTAFGSATSISFAAGQATPTLVAYKKETATISATAGAITTSVSFSDQVNDAGFSALAFSGLPAGATVGVALGSGSLTAQDTYGNTVTSFNASTNNVTISSGGATVSGLSGGNKLNAALDFNGTGVASLSSLVYTGTSGTVTFTATATGGSGTSGNVTMGAGAATQFSIGGSATQTAGTSQTITITANDAGGNAATSYAGSHSLTFGGAGSIGSNNPTVAGIAFGTATSLTFNASAQATAGMVLYKNENATVTATAGAVTTPSGLAVAVADAGFAGFSFSGLPASASVGTALGSGSLIAKDAYGNTAKSFNASLNNVTISSGGATISGLSGGNKLSTALDFTNGSASLSSLVYTGTTGSVAFTATATGGSGTSASVTMGAGAAATFQITGSGTQTAGASQALTIKAYDAGGNVATGYTGAKSLTFSGASNAPDATQPTVSDNGGANVAFGTAENVTFTNGQATAGGTLRLYDVETATIKATAGSVTTPSGLSVAVSAGSLAKFALSLTGAQQVGVAFGGTNTLTAQDGWSNVVTSFDASADNVTVSSGLGGTVSGLSGGGKLNALGDFSGGVANLTALGLKWTGTTGTGTFTATSASGKTGSSGSVTFGPGPAKTFAIAGSSSQVAGAAQSLTITAKDAGGNTATGYTGDQQLTFSGANPSPSSTSPTVDDKNGTPTAFGSATTITFTNGVASTGVALKLYKAESASVAAAATGVTTPSPLAVTVSAAGLQSFAVDLAGTETNGVAFAGTNKLTAKDAYGNVATGFDASADNVTITSSLGGTISGLSGGTKLTNAADFSNGVADLTALGLKYTGTSGSSTFTASSASGKSGTSASVTVVPGAAQTFAIAGSATQTAGAAQTLAVTAKDVSGNTATSYAGDKSLTFSGANASTAPVTAPTVTDKGAAAVAFGAATTIHFTAGVADAGGSLVLYRAESASIAATDGAVTTPSPLAVAVAPAALAKLALQLASPQTNAIAFTGTDTLTAQDAYGNTVTSFSALADPVTLTTTLPGAVGGLAGAGNVLNRVGDFSSGVADLHALGLTYTGTAGTGTFTATSASGKSGVSGSVTVAAGAAASFTLAGAATQTAGTAQTLTITAKDVSGNTATTYTGDHALTFSGASAAPDTTGPTVTDKTGTAVAFGSATTITFAGGVSSAGGSLKLYDVETAAVAVTDTSVSSSALSVAVSPAAASTLAVTSVNGGSNATAGTGFPVVVRTKDAYGNLAPVAADSGVLLSRQAGTGTLGGTTSGTIGSGQSSATINGVTYTAAESGVRLLATRTSGDTLSTGTSASFTVDPGAADHFTIGGSTAQTAGAAQSLTITAYDADGNLASGYTGDHQVTFAGASSSPDSTQPTVTDKSGTATAFGTPTTVTFANGVSSAGGSLKLYAVESATVTATDGAVTTPSALGVAVSPAAASALAVTSVNGGSNVTAGSGFPVTLRTKDAYGNLAPVAADTGVSLALASGSGTLGGTTGGTVGSGTSTLTIAGVTYTKAESGVSLTASRTSGDALSSATSAGFTVDPGTADHFGIAGAATQTAGGSQALTITAYDASGNVATSYTGDHALTFSGAGAAPNAAQPSSTDKSGTAVDFGTPATIAFAGGVSSAGGSVTLYKAESAALAVTDTSISSGAPLTIAVSPAALARFSLSLASPQANATAFTGTNQLTAVDAFGNAVTSFSALADPVTLTTTLSGTIGGLAGAGNVLNRAGDFAGGVADLSALGLKVTGPTGTGTFTATSQSGKTGTSGSVAVGPGAAASFTVTAPASADANVPQSVTVTAKDVSGNVATGYNGTVHLTSTDGAATLAGDYTFAPGDAGTHALAVTFGTAGSQTVTATDTGDGSIGGTSGAVNVLATATFGVSAPGSATAGSSFSVTVTAKNSQGDTAAGYRGTIHFTSSDGQAVLPADYTFTSGDAGVHTFTATLKTAASETIGVADTGDGSVNGTSAGTDVSPAAAARLVYTSSTADLASQSSRTLRVEVRDAYGNLETGDSSTSVTFAKSSGAGTVSGLGSATASAGVATESVTGQLAGAIAIDASATGLTGDSSAFAVVPGPTDHFVLGGSGSQTAGTAQALSITAEDAAGNTATGYTGDHALTFSGASPAAAPVTVPTVTDRDGNAVALGAATTITFAGGVASAGGSLTLYDAENASIGVTDGSAPSSAPLAVTVGAGALAKFSLQLASPQANAAPFSGTSTLTAQDAWGNTVTTFSALADPVTLTTSLGGTISGLGGAGDVLNRAGDFAAGVADLGTLGLTYTGTAGSGTFTATAQTGESGTSSSIVLNPGAATSLRIASVDAGSDPVAGSPFDVVVRPLDVSGNVTAVAADTDVSLAVGTGAGTLGGTTTGTIPSGQSTATISGVTYTKAETGVTLVASRTAGDALASTTSAPFDVDAGAAAGFVLGAAATQTAGSSQTLTITAVDADGNVATSYTGSHSLIFSGASASPNSTLPTVTASGGAAIALGGATPITFTNGIATAGGSLTLYDVEAASISVTDMTISSPQSLDVTVLPADAADLQVTAGASQTAGSSFSAAVTAYDGYGNVATGYRGTVHLASSDPAASLAADHTFTALDAGSRTFAVTLTTAGSQTVTATDTSDGTITGTTGAIDVAPGPAAKLVYTSGTADLASGATRQLRIEVRDAYDNLETADGSTQVDLSASGTGSVSGLGAATASGGVATRTVTGVVAGPVTIDATASGLGGDSTGFAVVAGAADHLTFTSSTTDLASGSTRTLKAEVRDAAGNLVTADSSTSVTFVKSGGSGTLTGLASATASGGVAAEDVTGALAGAITVDATATGLTSDSTGFAVVPGPADHLAFTSSTTDLASGSTRTLKAEVRDAAGNLLSGDNTTSVTFAASGTGTLTGLAAATASAGIASEDVTAVLAGPLGLTASATGLTGDSQSLTVVPGPADHLAFTSATSDLASGSTRTLEADVLDAAGNLLTGDNTTSVTFAKASGAGTLTGLGAATASGGTASEDVTADLAGAITLDAGATGLSGDSQTFTIVPGPADHLAFTSATGNLASGSSRTLTAEIRDAAGNLVTADNSTSVTFAKSSGAGTLTGIGSATASGGVASDGVTGDLAGTIDLDASATGLTGDSQTFSVVPGPADHLALTSSTADLASGSTRTLTAEIRDAAGNVVTSDGTTTVDFAQTGGPGSLASLGTGGAVAGVASHDATAVLAGPVTVTATATGLAPDSASFDVVPGPADHLTFTSDTSDVASGSTRTLTAEIRDAAGNVVTSDGTTSVSFAQYGGAGGITGAGSAVASGGVASRTVTGDGAGQVMLQATATGLTADVTSFAVVPGPADHVTFTSATTDLASGATRTLTAEIRDAAGNLVTGDSTTSVTFAQSSGSGSLSGLGTATAAGGVASADVTAGTDGSVTLSASATGLGGDAQTFAIVAGAADHLTFTSSTSDLTSGASRTLTVEVRDAAGNVVTGDDSTSVTFAKSSGAGSVSGVGTATASSGVASQTIAGDLAGSITLSATATGLAGDTTTFTIVPGAADHLVLTSATTDLASGSTRTLTAEVRDAAGNLVTGDNSTSVAFAESSGAGTLTGLGAATASGGTASEDVTGDLAGTITLDAGATGLSGDSQSLTVVPGPADHLSLTSSTADLASGTTRTLKADVLDAAGNLVSGDNSTSVTFATSSGAGTLTGIGSATASGGVASNDVTGGLAGTITLDASATGLRGDTQSFTIVPGPADHLTFTSSTTDLASGSSRTLTAEIRDAAGNLVTGDDSTSVSFGQGSGPGSLSGLGSATASGGLASEDVTGVLAGGVTLTASASGLTGDGQSFTVVPGPADHLTFTSSTADLASGTARTLTAEIRDAAGNLVTGDSSTSVAFGQGSGSGSLSGLGSATASGGVASNDVTGGLAGGVTLTASAGGLTGDGQSFTVVPGSADHLTFTSATADLASGATRTLTAEVRDAAGNLLTSDGTTSVTFARSAGPGTLTGLAATTASGGIASDTVTGSLAGTITLAASATGLSGDGQSFTVVPGPADHLTFTSSTADLASGSTRTLTAEIRDAAGNLVTGDGSTSVTFARTAGPGTLTGLGSATASGGVASKTVTGLLAGGVTLDASATGLGSGAQGFAVVAGPADHLAFTSATTSLASGTNRTLTAEIRDAAGNLVTGDNSTSVTFAKTGGAGTLSGLGAATASGGIASDTVTGQLAGSVTLDASATGFGGDTQGFTVVTGAPDHLTFTSSTADLTSGASRTLTAEVRDAAGNLVASDNSTSVTFARSAGAGTLAGLGAATAADGVASETVTAQLAGAITVDAAATGLAAASSSFTIDPGAAASLDVAAPASITAGTPITISVTARDAAGNVATGYDGTIHLTSDDSQASLPSDYGFGAGDAGRHDFAVTLETRGTRTVTATDTADATLAKTSAGIAVSSDVPSTATSTIAAADGTLVADGSSTTTVTVQLEDQYGNDVTASGGTLALATTRGTLSGVTDNGDGTYTATLSAPTAAGTATISGTLNGTALAHTAQVDFAAGPAAEYVVTASSASPTVGTGVTITAQLADAQGNAVTGSGDVVTWSKTGAGGSFGAATSTTDAAGVATVTFTTGTSAGTTYAVTANDGSHAGTSSAFTSVAAAPDHYAASAAPASPVAGAAVAIDAQLEDVYGNAVPSAGVTVNWSKTGAGGSFAAASSQTDAAGRAAISFTTGTAAGTTYAVTADDGTRSGTTAAFTTVVGPVDAARSSVTAGTGSLAADGSASTSVTVAVSDANGNPIAGASVSLDQGGTTSSVAPASAATDGSGVAVFTVGDAYAEHVVYSATAGSTAIAQTAAVDFVPDTSITAEPADPSNAAGPVFSFASGSLGAGFECSLDGGAYASCTSPDTLAGLAEGSHTFDVRATGAGVADPTPSHYAWTVDLTAPSVTLGAPADGTVVHDTVTLSATATDNYDSSPAIAYEYRATGDASWTATGAAWSTDSLADGSYDVHAVARDAAGNSRASATATVRVDNHAPAVTATPPRYVNAADGGTVTVSATSADSDVAQVEFFDCPTTDPTCATSIGTDTSAPYGVAWDESGHADGDRVIRAVATDLGGLTGSDAKTVTIDRTAPAGASISYAGGWNTSGSVTIATANGSDDGSGLDLSSATLLRKLGDVQSDGTCASYGAFAPVPGSPDTVADGKCAVYRYSIADEAGNATTVDGPEVKVDTTAPTTTITSKPNDPDNDATPDFAFSASESGATFECRIDTGSWQVCVSPTTLTTLGDGSHTFDVRATDRAGNVETAPPSYTWTVDSVPPAASMVAPANYVRGTIGLVSNSTDSGGSGIVTTQFQVSPAGAGSWSDIGSSFDTASVADGLYDFHVIVVDRAGNVGTSATVQNIRVDNTKPVVAVTSPAASSSVKDTVALAATATDADPSPTVVFEVAPQGTTSWTTVPASWDTKTVADGEYQIRATATDWAGNAQSATSDHVLVDNEPPTVSLTDPADGSYVNAAAADPYTVKATAADTGSGVADVQFFACSTSDCTGGTLAPLGTVAAPGPYQASWPIPADGVHALEAVAHDGAGHSATAISAITVDRTPPATTILTKPGDPTNDAAPSFTFSSDDPTATFECRLDGDAWSPCTSPWTLATAPADGTHTVDVRAFDPAGNADPTPDTWTWLEDRTAPDATIDDPAAANAAHAILGTILLTSSESDPGGIAASGIDTVTYQYCDTSRDCGDQANWASLPVNEATWDTATIDDGIYDVHVVVTDRAGNATTSADAQDVKVDNTVPQSAQDDPGAYLRQTVNLTGSAADPQDRAGNDGSGIDHVEFQVSPTGLGSWTTIGSASGLAGPYGASYDTTSGATPDGVYDFRTIAYDRAGNAETQSTAVTGRMVDNTPPTATITDPGQYLRGTVHLASTTDDPLTNGVASGVAQVTYEYANESDGVWHQTPAGWDTTSLPDGTYDVRVTAIDRAGNSTTSSAVTGRVVDNTKPVTTDDAPSGWQSSGVTIHLSASDSGSGVNTTEHSLDGGAWTGGTSVSVPAVDGSHTVSYFSADNAGNVEAVKTVVVLIDTTPPACASCSASDYYHGTVTLTATPTSGPSPITSVKFQLSTDRSTWTTIGRDTTAAAGTYSVPWNTAAYPDGGYYLRVTIVNAAGTKSRVDLHGGTIVVVDNTPPTASVGAPVGGAVVGGTITIAAVAHDANDLTYSFAADGATIANTTSPTTTWDTTTHRDGTVSITVTATDPAGNSTTSAGRTIRIDNTAPTPSLDDPGQAVRGTISLSATSDSDTQTVEFQRSPAGAGAWTTIATVGAPFGATLDTTALSDGLYDLRVVATDESGHVGTSSIRTTRVDNTPPTATLASPPAGRTVGGPHTTLAGNASDSGSGIASVEFQYSPAGAGTWQTIGSSATAPYQFSWNATGIPTGDYDLHIVVTDAAGNSRTTAPVRVHVDSTPPSVSLHDPGSRLSGAVTLAATTGGSDADRVVFDVSPAGANSWTTIGTDGAAPWSQSFNTSSVPDGLYDLRATVYDSLDNSSSSVVTGVRIDNSAPTLVSSTPADGATVASATSIVLVASEAVTAPGTTLDGSPVAAPVVVGTQLSFNTGALGAGLHTLAGNLRDAVGNTTPFQIHFTVGSTSGSGTTPAPTAGNTKSAASSTVTSADGSIQVTVPPGAWQSSSGDWVVVGIDPATPPSGLTGLDVASTVVDISAHWAIAGTTLHHFDRPLDIVFRNASQGAVPATSDGTWRLLAPVPQSGTLPDAWDDGYYVSGGDVHILTRHLSLFALMHDSAPPTPPTRFTGRVQSGNLTLGWAPGTDNSGVVAGFQVYVNGTATAQLPASQPSYAVGPYDPNDTHLYTVSESDAAGNVSAQTKQLTVLPALVGLPLDQARAALEARGFGLGDLTQVESSQPAGTVVGPTDLVLAEIGAPVDLDVSTGEGDGAVGTKLAFSVVSTKHFAWTARGFLGARVKTTRAVALTVNLLGRSGERLYTWRLHVKAGIRILKLRMPHQVRRAGRYTLVWTASAGSSTVRRTVPLQVGAQRISQPVQIVIAGDRLPRALRGPHTIAAAGGAAFDVTGNPRANVQVIVVDADEYGLGIAHDLNTVFPGVRIVVLSDDPKKLARAVAAGASLAVPRQTPPKKLEKLIADLARKPKF